MAELAACCECGKTPLKWDEMQWDGQTDRYYCLECYYKLVEQVKKLGVT